MRALFLFPLVSGLLAVAAPAAVAGEYQAEATGVAGGDVVTVIDADGNRYEVRLAGVDAPELDQPYGELARKRLAELVLGKAVRVEWEKVDRNGRAVGKLWVGSPDSPCQGSSCAKTLDVGHALITQGLAWHFKRYQSEQSEEDRARYGDDEVEARARRTGLWSEPDPVPPWEWREGKR